jgi:hypothetical protein
VESGNIWANAPSLLQISESPTAWIAAPATLAALSDSLKPELVLLVLCVTAQAGDFDMENGDEQHRCRNDVLSSR